MSSWDSAAFDRWLTTDPENQPEMLEDEICDLCGKPVSIGDHTHPNMRWDDLWGLVDE